MDDRAVVRASNAPTSESASTKPPVPPPITGRTSPRGLNNAENAKRLAQVKRVAKLMDAQYRIPGTPIRFGWDGLIGLIPGVGDTVSAVTGFWIMAQAHQLGMSKAKMGQMLANIAVEVVVGSVPLVGDAFDVYWKSNVRNARMLEKHLRDLTPEDR